MLATKKIGNKIAEARKKVNISQAQLAEQLFISPQAVGKWERGESMPDIVTFNHLAEILGVDLNYFSESFQSTSTETVLVGTEFKHSSELPSVKEKKKHSWNMSLGNWVDADFSGLNNLHEKFSFSNMKGCKFVGSDMSGLFLKSNHVDACDFSSSNISGSEITTSNLLNNLFKECSLKEAKFSGSNNIEGCDFSSSDISKGQFHVSNLLNNLFRDCSLQETEFSWSYIMGCDFSGSDFTGATFKSGGFQNNPMAKVVMKRVSFNAMQIVETVFEGMIDDCYFENCNFKKVTFQDATFMNTFFKNNKNMKRIRFIDCKADRISYEFLKQGKADLTGITLLTTKGENE
jgi:uncharacterized protein YjbI with pentapeptide repeats